MTSASVLGGVGAVANNLALLSAPDATCQMTVGPCGSRGSEQVTASAVLRTLQVLRCAHSAPHPPLPLGQHGHVPHPGKPTVPGPVPQLQQEAQLDSVLSVAGATADPACLTTLCGIRGSRGP